jgi:hypothetical protein
MNQDDQWSMVSSLSENETGRASVRWLVDVGLYVGVIVWIVRRVVPRLSGANKWEKGRHWGPGNAERRNDIPVVPWMDLENNVSQVSTAIFITTPK